MGHITILYYIIQLITGRVDKCVGLKYIPLPCLSKTLQVYNYPPIKITPTGVKYSSDKHPLKKMHKILDHIAPCKSINSLV